MNNQNQQTMPVSTPASVFPGVGDLLKRAWQIYKKRIRVLLGIAALPLIFALLFPLIIQPISKEAPILSLFLFIVFWLGAVIVGFWSQVSLIFAIKEREEKIGIRESLRRGWPKLVSFAWVSILVGFITMGGFLLFIIPGIIFTVWFSLATYILVAEDLRGTNTLFRSKQWIAGNWWKVFWRFLMIGAIALVIYVGITLSITFLIGKDASDIASRIISFLLTPFFVTYAFLIYEDLKKLKGEIPLEAQKRERKIKYILIGAVGLLLIPGILASTVLVSLMGAGERAKDAKVIADMAQIRVMAEITYSKEGNYSEVSCTYPDLVSSCSDIKSLMGKEPVIYSSSDEYCLYSRLPSGDYYCIDTSYMGVRRTSVYPGGSGYCTGATFVCP